MKRSTLVQQLNQPEYEAIQQVISGELKAVDTIIHEFIHTFELREVTSDHDRNQEVKGEGEEHDSYGSHNNPQND